MTTTTTKKDSECCDDCRAEIESAWHEETKTLKQTIRLYFPPARPEFKQRGRSGKVKVYTKEEIKELISKGAINGQQSAY